MSASRTTISIEEVPTFNIARIKKTNKENRSKFSNISLGRNRIVCWLPLSVGLIASLSRWSPAIHIGFRIMHKHGKSTDVTNKAKAPRCSAPARAESSEAGVVEWRSFSCAIGNSGARMYVSNHECDSRDAQTKKISNKAKVPANNVTKDGLANWIVELLRSPTADCRNITEWPESW